MQQKVALAMFAILLISNIGASAPANENVLHPNIVRAMDDADANTQIEFIDGFFGKATASQIRDLSKQDDIFWIEHNSQMEYYMQDTTRVINAVETWQTVIINEDEQVIADQADQHTYIDGTGVAAVIIDTGVDAGHPDFDYDEGKTVSYKFDRATRTWIEAENSDMNQNVIKVSVPVSNKFEILSTTSDNMNVQPMAVNSDPSKKLSTCTTVQSDHAISLESNSYSSPIRSPSFTPPVTPTSASISKTLEEEIIAAIRGAWKGE